MPRGWSIGAPGSRSPEARRRPRWRPRYGRCSMIRPTDAAQSGSASSSAPRPRAVPLWQSWRRSSKRNRRRRPRAREDRGEGERDRVVARSVTNQLPAGRGSPPAAPTTRCGYGPAEPATACGATQVGSAGPAVPRAGSNPGSKLSATESDSEQPRSPQSAESQRVRLDRSGWGPGGRRFKSCLPDRGKDLLTAIFGHWVPHRHGDKTGSISAGLGVGPAQNLALTRDLTAPTRG